MSQPAWGTPARASVDDVIRAHFCPDLRRAAFAITDHGDRTKLGPSKALYLGHSDESSPEFRRRGFLANGVRVTQGVFVSGWDGHDYLDNPAFMALMREVSAGGCEVCPHNTSEHMDLPAAQVHENIEIYRRNFGLTTWIDHFRLPSNLSQQGMNPSSEYYILDRFRQAGGNAAWSFRDVYGNAPGPWLDSLQVPPLSTYARALAAEARQRGTPGSRRRASAYLTHMLAACIGTEALGSLLVLRKPLRDVGGRRKLQASARLSAALAKRTMQTLSGRLPAPSFPVRFDNSSRLFWFDTVRVLFTSVMYRPEGLDDLIGGRGIHIGHTYLGLVSPKYPDTGFERAGDQYRVADGFESFLQSVRARVEAGELWNPTMREMAAWFTRLRAIQVTDTGAGLRLRNTAAEPLRGLTLRSRRPLLLPEGTAARIAAVDGEHWTCVDIPAGAELKLAKES